MKMNELIQAALREDIPEGDITTDSLALEKRLGIAKLLAKADIVLSGRSVFEETILTLETDAEIKWYFNDGELVLKGQNICSIKGDLIQILKAERVALNFICHLSGIATLTRRYVDQIKNTRTEILDTRKTLPNYRELERKAVRDGGGSNHRLNLSDMVMIKDNHIRAVGSITTAVQRVRSHTTSKIIVEVRTQDEVQEAVRCNVDRVLLDNMSLEQMQAALAILPAHIESEASGNMTLDRVKPVAELGVTYISVGALTHSAPFADISLMFDWQRPPV